MIVLIHHVDLCIWGGIPRPRVHDLEGKPPQGKLVGIEPKYGLLAPIMIWDKTLMHLQHVMEDDDITWKDNSSATKIV